MNYFQVIVNNLSIDDLNILGILHDKNANVKFKALKKKELKEISELTDSNYRKTLYRLEIAQFIKIVTGEKDHKIFITEMGNEALLISLSEEVI